MSKSNHFHAILFDLDGTLLHDQPRSFDTLVNYLQERGHTFPLAQLKQAECWGHYYWIRSPESKADEETFGGHNHTLVLDKPVEARYVKFACKASRFMDVSEVEVLDGVKSEPFDLKIALPAGK